MQGAVLVRTIVVAAAVFGPATAHAYLDPGTGSFILQMLVAGFLGAMLYVKLAWARTRLFFAQLFSGNRKSAQPDAEETDEDDTRQ